jgi:translocation and assembly module TamB
MAEKDLEKKDPTVPATPAARRRYFSRRNVMFAGGFLVLLVLLLGILAIVLYRTGQVDNYTRNRFREKMAEMGIVFDADVFRLNISPLELELQNATFTDKVTGEKLFFIRDAHLKMTVLDYFALRASRDIRIDTTDINGAEVWVNFNENGESNFRNVHLVENEQGTAVNFKYDSINFALKDSVIHFGDLSRHISGNGKNVVFLLSPTNPATPDEQKRYNFDLTSTESNFTYEENVVENISVKAVGVADGNGAEIRSFDLKTPIGETAMSGTLVDWASPQYNFDITSSIDLTQASGIFANGTALNGVGNFKGKLTGQGESYHIEGEADAASLRAGGVYLKAVNVAATVEGTNTNYEANGNAVAELLTFDDFRIDFVKMAGNVRGTGTDFRWVGELQAAAAKSPKASIVGLFLSDALAEYKDKQLRAEAGTGRARQLTVGDNTFSDLSARSVRFGSGDDSFNLTSPSANARSFATKAFKLNGLSGRDLNVKNVGQRTDVDARALRADSMELKGNVGRNIRADRFHMTDVPGPTDVILSGLQADRVRGDGVIVDGVSSPELRIHDVPAETIVYADKLRVAKLDTSSAVLGSLNVGGVRLTIRRGVVEGRTNDVDAGTISLKKTSTLKEGGELQAVRIAHPVFTLEPSGRYRASADMSIGGGTVGSIGLGAATAKVDISNDRVAFNGLNAAVMNGNLTGTAVIGLNSRTQSRLDGNFTNLDIGKLLALQGGRIIPISGQTTGQVNLTFNGTSFRNASGTLNADINANAGAAGTDLIPINGQVKVTGTNGLFNVDTANLSTQSSSLVASGRFDLRNEDSNLALDLRSRDASEVDRLIRVLGVSSEMEKQLDDMQAQFAGNLTFNGTVTGNLTDPTIDGRAALDRLLLKGREVGSVSTDIAVSPLIGVELKNGKLQQTDGGNATFALTIPNTGANNVTVNATLTGVNAGSLLAALPITLPAQIADFNGSTTGTVNITGLPNNAQGEVNLAAASGTIAGQAFDNLKVKAVFAGTTVDLQQAEMRIGSGSLTANGRYDRVSTEFNFDVTGKQIPAGLMLAFAPRFDTPISGDVDFAAKATGFSDRSSTYNINFSGSSPNVTVGQNALGAVTFKGVTANQMLTADVTADLNGHPQVATATVNLGNEDMPFTAVTEFNQSPLAPFLAFLPQVKDLPITGTGTGKIEFGGNLSKVVDGKRVFSAEGLSGTASFSQLALLIQDTPLNAAEPILIRFNTQEIVFEKARFSGGGSNMTIAGTKALTDTGVNDLSIDGRVNLNLLNVISKDTFFSGFADTSVRFVGLNSTARISGTANIVNGSVATFLGSDRFQFDRVNARIIFTTNQFEVDDASGYLGGGKFTASGGGMLAGLKLQAFRFDLIGNNVTVPLPKDFITTGDAQLQFSGQRRATSDVLQVTIGGRVNAKRSLYSKDVDLASILSGRRDPTLSTGGSSIAPPRFDIVIEGRDALIVKNNIADLTASVSLTLTGNADDPRISGRITANSGTILFRKDRYVLQRGVLEFPPDTGFEPIVNIQAESEIAGYQVFVNLSGPLKDSEQLNATVRSSPALPQADVVSLITTGNLANSTGGIPTLASTGINTAAEVLADAIINNPVRKATDKLFGLNVFEIDPILSGTQTNPTARLTVGRQINNNLRVTYSTNISQDQNQVFAVEYRVSNKLSVVAKFEQPPLSNVTRARNNFEIEIRFRKRF